MENIEAKFPTLKFAKETKESKEFAAKMTKIFNDILYKKRG